MTGEFGLTGYESGAGRGERRRRRWSEGRPEGNYAGVQMKNTEKFT